MVLQLLEEGAYVDEKNYRERYTWLHLASSCGHAEVAELLIERGADVNARSIYRETPLHLASLNGRIEMVNLLVREGADLNARNQDGSTPLHVACSGDQKEVVELLLEKGADINAKSDYDKATPLHTASRYGFEKVAMLLLRNGANVNAQDNEGESPLWGAMSFCIQLEELDIGSNDISIIKMLVENGSDVNEKNNHGLTPLHLASNHGYGELVQYLLETGAEVSAKNEDGNTPLHEVCNTEFYTDSHEEVVKLLLVEGADVNAKNNYGFTPLDLAKKYGNDSLIKLLKPSMKNGKESIHKCNNSTTNQSSQMAIIENSNEPSLIVDSHIEEMTNWLLTFLREVDAIKYRDCFIEKGFDTMEILKHVVEESDLEFMKIGHRRMATMKLLELRQE